MTRSYGVAATVAARAGSDPQKVVDEAIAEIPIGRFTTPEGVGTWSHSSQAHAPARSREPRSASTAALPPPCRRALAVHSRTLARRRISIRVPPYALVGRTTRGQAVDDEVDLSMCQYVPLALYRQRPREQRGGDDQILGRQVSA